MIATRAAFALALLGSAALAAHPPATRSGSGPGFETLERPEQDREAELIARYLAALGEFRAGMEPAHAALMDSAQTLADVHKRPDALAVAEYYESLSADDRRVGLALERRFDALRDELVLLEETGAGAPDVSDEALARVRSELEVLLQTAERVPDVTPAARTAALLARLDVRRVEMSARDASDEAADLAHATALATNAMERFTVAGQRTPRLEPTWILARIALLQGDAPLAESWFESLESLAVATDRVAWRERALLGLVGLAQARGAHFGVRRFLERLATFRAPEDCWALAREIAIQRLSEDEPERALDLLEACPPSELDGEIVLETALEEWRALIVAAQLRAGQVVAAEASLENSSPRTGTAADEVHDLARVALMLDLGRAAHALTLLEARASRPAASDLGRVEALVLRGRALIALGHPAEAIPPLERAFSAALTRDLDRNLAAASPDMPGRSALRDASAVGEWLGLSAVEALARAHALSGDPLRAGAAIEAAHAACSIEEARSRLLELAGSTQLGAVTWVVGADRTLAVHVRSDGSATSSAIALGRREIVRAVHRVRDVILETRIAPAADRSQSLRMEVAAAILPDTLRADISAAVGEGDGHGAAPTLVLLPHGVLDRLPFESLLVADDEHTITLGLEIAVAISPRLRPGSDLAPAIDGRRAHWTAFGAPVNTGLPSLDDARRELRSLEALQPRLVAHRGLAFDRQSLLAALSDESPVHVATHVAPDPSGSTIAPFGLLTSGGSIVTADEIARCAPRLPLLVLLACGSAEGRSIDGLGARGIAQAALDGGTRAAVVTLWPIEDGAGRIAAVTLHAALLDGATAPEAVRRARATLVSVGAPVSEWAAYRLLGRP